MKIRIFIISAIVMAALIVIGIVVLDKRADLAERIALTVPKPPKPSGTIVRPSIVRSADSSSALARTGEAAPLAEPLEKNDASHAPKVDSIATSAPANAQALVRSSQNQNQNQLPIANPKGWLDLDARLALSYVGFDSDAEDYWVNAINNPALPAKERQDLIEDLNEDGFADPKNPTVEELPLIINRLILIEELAPSAMDDVNYAAFAEAYKDLANMYVRLTRR